MKMSAAKVYSSSRVWEFLKFYDIEFGLFLLLKSIQVVEYENFQNVMT